MSAHFTRIVDSIGNVLPPTRQRETRYQISESSPAAISNNYRLHTIYSFSQLLVPVTLSMADLPRGSRFSVVPLQRPVLM
jgi:hypothetical protein